MNVSCIPDSEAFEEQAATADGRWRANMAASRKSRCNRPGLCLSWRVLAMAC